MWSQPAPARQSTVSTTQPVAAAQAMTATALARPIAGGWAGPSGGDTGTESTPDGPASSIVVMAGRRRAGGPSGDQLWGAVQQRAAPALQEQGLQGGAGAV